MQRRGLAVDGQAHAALMNCLLKDETTWLRLEIEASRPSF